MPYVICSTVSVLSVAAHITIFEDYFADLATSTDEHHLHLSESAGKSQLAFDTRVPLSALPLKTDGKYIVSAATHHRVRLFCVNWYGSHLEQLVPNGLNRQPLKRIVARIVELGFNCVRLPFSLEMIGAPTVPLAERSLEANPTLQGLTPLQVYDATVDALTDANVMVIVNNHVSAAGWCCGVHDDEALWYTPVYSEETWLKGLGFMAGRYKYDLYVIGFDLRNEVRNTDGVTASWGTGDKASDWATAAAKGGSIVLARNEQMLIIVSGLNFGMYLCDVPNMPLHSLSSLHGHIVYTTHEYPWFNFHIAVRDMIELRLPLVTCVCVLICFGLGGQLVKRRSREVCETTSPSPASCCRPPDTGGRFEFIVAIALDALALTLAFFHTSLASGCGLDNSILDMALTLIVTYVGTASFVLWIRLAVLYGPEVAKSLLDRAGRSTQPALGTEMTPYPRGQEVESGAREHTIVTATHGVTTLLRSCECLAIGQVLALLCTLLIVWANFGTYHTFATELDHRWGFMLRGNENSSAPVWLGEFGAEVETLWWRHMMRYIKSNEIDFAYWSFNGQKTIFSDETYGIVAEDSVSVRSWWKLHALQKHMSSFEDW